MGQECDDTKLVLCVFLDFLFFFVVIVVTLQSPARNTRAAVRLGEKKEETEVFPDAETTHARRPNVLTRADVSDSSDDEIAIYFFFALIYMLLCIYIASKVAFEGGKKP